MLVRRPLGLNLLHVGDGFDFYEPGGRRGWDVQALGQHNLVALLVLSNAWKEKSLLSESFSAQQGLDKEQANNAINYLIEKGLLITDEDPGQAYLGSSEAVFKSYNWHEPLLFHWHTNRYPKLDYFNDPRDEKDQAMMRRYLSTEAPPSNYKDYHSQPEILLERGVVKTQRPINDVMGDEGMGALGTGSTGLTTLDDLSWFMYLAFGQTRVRNMQLTGRHVAKTSPSGGSRHPTEAYTFILSNEELELGLYHYSVRKHSLELLATGDHRSFVQDNIIIHSDRPDFEPTVVFLYSCIFERSMHRYRDSRSYRVVHKDIGHVMQTVAYLAKARGCPSYGGYSLKDSVVDEFVGLDGILESSMAYTVVG